MWRKQQQKNHLLHFCLRAEWVTPGLCKHQGEIVPPQNLPGLSKALLPLLHLQKIVDNAECWKNERWNFCQPSRPHTEHLPANQTLNPTCPFWSINICKISLGVNNRSKNRAWPGWVEREGFLQRSRGTQSPVDVLGRKVRRALLQKSSPAHKT